MSQLNNKVVETMRQIISSARGIIEEAKDNKFKRKCLQIIEAEDFSEFQDKLTSKLLSCYKHRHHHNYKYKHVNTEKVTPQSPECKNTGYSPIRKRIRKEPLTVSNISQEEQREISQHLTNTSCSPPNNENACKSVENKENWPLENQNVTTSPSFVDVSKLCDFINGVDNQIDTWLHNYPTTPTNNNKRIANDVTTNNFKTNCVTQSNDVVPTIDKNKNENEIDTKSRSFFEFEETLTDITEIIGETHVTNNNSLKRENVLDIRETSTDVLLEESAGDWLDDFENDEYWGQKGDKENQENVVNLHALQLFNLNEQ